MTNKQIYKEITKEVNRFINLKRVHISIDCCGSKDYYFSVWYYRFEKNGHNIEYHSNIEINNEEDLSKFYSWVADCLEDYNVHK